MYSVLLQSKTMMLYLMKNRKLKWPDMNFPPINLTSLGRNRELTGIIMTNQCDLINKSRLDFQTQNEKNRVDNLDKLASIIRGRGNGG